LFNHKILKVTGEWKQVDNEDLVVTEYTMCEELTEYEMGGSWSMEERAEKSIHTIC
jgi:hypothetical protein